ncbi:monocarboxylate transporter 2-like [Hyla sarda]|uniref:monocarboxylate transporter 2-like n=1 Tax=Hyla sarda TaxID=327740 RepID=UPI0024C322A4|nr:monocarboxylate transporter 2-like [Hyla sarda]XP_056380541.1 monocarboxylate transporter 2-like [Hyla sarda]XP_056380542.1 monocarboxylate transporter 2-like [Hyla sarda]XP_056380543.1 monocarboxylate transporter 2-like [Hyla sarda]XP_056380544.1 monocarboxylate transporter 2-like [Hyla sarda]
MAPTAGTDLGYTPPDGGWGWMVVVGAFISMGFSYAFSKAVTVFYKEIQDFFGASYSEIAWISSLLLACMYAGGPVSSILVNRYGSRPVVIAGGLLSGIGMILATFCTSIIQLYICVGVIAGFGFSMNLQPSVIVVGKYFLKKRPMANGLAMAGSPVVLSTLAPLNQFLFDKYGWRGSFLILGALLLNCCVAGALFRPIGLQTKTKKDKPDKDPEKINISLAGQEKNLKPEKKETESCLTKFNKVLDLSLFKHRGFLIYLIGNVLMFIAFYAPIVFLAPYGKHLGVDEYSAAFLLSVLAIVDMIARPATGIIANTKWIRPRIQYFFSFSVIFNGFCHLMCPFATSYVGLVVYSVFFGLGFGMVCSLLFETLMDLVGAKRFSSAVGLVTIVECVPLLLGPPIGGAIVDTFGDYKYMFFECGAIMVFAGLFLLIGNFYNYRMLRKEAELENQELKKDLEMKDGSALKKRDYEQVSSDDKPKNGNEVQAAKCDNEKCEDVNGSGHQC